jgi:hypothetical protein
MDKKISSLGLLCLDQLKQGLGKLLVVSQQCVMVWVRGMGAIRPLHADTHVVAGLHANITAVAGKHNAAAAALQTSHGIFKAAGGAYVHRAHSAAPTTRAAYSTNVVRGGGTRTPAQPFMVQILVGAAVFGEIAALGEAFLAELAGVGLLARVNANVSLQHHFLAERLRALLALTNIMT